MDIVILNKKLKSTKDKVTIYFAGDLHIGNVNFDRRSFVELINIIKEDQNAYFIGMGDYLDCININDKRFDAKTIDKTYRIKDLSNLAVVQAQDFIKLVTPIKDKILLLLSGNHESKYTRVYNMDIFTYICDKLNVSYRIENVGMVKLNVAIQNRDNRMVTMFLNHGDGGNGKREGYPLNILHDVFRWSDCDVNIMGHIHQLVEDKKYFFSINPKTNKFSQRAKLYGVSGTFLKTYEEGNINYFEHKGRYGNDIGCLRLTISYNYVKNKQIGISENSRTLDLLLEKVRF